MSLKKNNIFNTEINQNIKSKIDATMFIQNRYKCKKNLLENLNCRLLNLYDYIFSISSRIDDNYSLNIISQEKYVDHNTRIESIIKIYQTIPRPIIYSSKDRPSLKKISSYISFLESIVYDICIICGAYTVYDILEIIIGDGWNNKFNEQNLDLLQYYNLILSPINCYIIDDREKNDINLDSIIIKEITNLSNGIIENIQGGEICIPYDNKVLIISGIFKKDSTNLSRIGGNIGLGYKSTYIQEAFDIIHDIPKSFKEGYINSLSLRDFILLDRDTIIDRLIESYNLLENIKKQGVSYLLKVYSNANFDKQRELLTIFLLDDSDKKTKFIASILYNMVNNNNDIITIDSIYKSLQWPIQNMFNKVFNNVKKHIDGVENIEYNEEKDYENKIRSLEISDYIKGKAYDKLKEFKMSKDSGSSSKAQQYLDGLLKIPFGVYKKEKIIDFINIYSDDLTFFFKKYYDKLMIYINENVHNSRKLKTSENLLNIMESYLNNNPTKEREIDNFMLEINQKVLIPIDQHINQRQSINKLKHKYGIHNNLINNHEGLVDFDDLNSSNISTSSDKTNFNEKNPKHEQIKLKISNINIRNNIVNDINNELKQFYIKWEAHKLDKKNYILNVRNILNNAVYGHKDAKQQLERIIGQWINGKMEGAVLGIQGPPGTGKTTLCKKGLAKCLLDENDNPRPFAFLPLGGSNDGSTLEGHNYTYVGSTWGRLVDILMEKKCLNPIIYIDEIDKISKTEHGKELIGILTHLTDSSQNCEFQDKYFAGIKIDLSKALIVFSYNDSDMIDRILKDRITEIRTKPLTKSEKIEITKNYLMPEILDSVGYTSKDILIDNDNIEFLIDTYTFEAGVRKLKEKLYEIVREINLRRIKMEDDNIEMPIIVDKNIIEKILSNKSVIINKKIHPKSYIGIMNGLYATSLGTGGIITVEAFKTLSDVKLSLELTGQQGDVMKESVKCAKTIAWNLLPNNIKADIKKEWDTNGVYGLHVHCPEGGTPKDGPSAGGVMTLVILSQLCGIAIMNNVAMTGEIDLNGSIRAIGGLESKLQGAKSAGVNLVLIPKDNKKDLDDIPEDSKNTENFKVIMIETIYEAIPYVFEKNDINFVKFGVYT